MPEDTKNGVPPGEASPEAPPTGVPPAPETASPFNEERIRALIAEESERVRRLFQSEKDKAIAQTRKEVLAFQRQAEESQELLTSMRSRLAQENPDMAQALELEELRGERRRRQTRDAEELSVQKAAEFDRSFRNNMVEFVQEMGIDPEDKRIDWGEDSPDYLIRQAKIQKSVAKLQKEGLKALEQGLHQKLKEAEQTLRKELGLDTIDSTQAAGSGITGQGILSQPIPRNMTPKELRDYKEKLVEQLRKPAK